MCIRYLTQSTWKVRNGEARSAGKMKLSCPLPIRSWVSEWSKSLGWCHWCHHYLVVFHPFVGQLTVFHTSGLILASSSIFRVLDLDLHAMCAGILSGTCRKVCKLCINPYISIINSLRTDIQAQPQTKAPLAPTALTAPARLWASC